MPVRCIEGICASPWGKHAQHDALRTGYCSHPFPLGCPVFAEPQEPGPARGLSDREV
jgi:hypothetical protein